VTKLPFTAAGLTCPERWGADVGRGVDVGLADAGNATASSPGRTLRMRPAMTTNESTRASVVGYTRRRWSSPRMVAQSAWACEWKGITAPMISAPSTGEGRCAVRATGSRSPRSGRVIPRGLREDVAPSGPSRTQKACGLGTYQCTILRSPRVRSCAHRHRCRLTPRPYANLTTLMLCQTVGIGVRAGGGMRQRRCWGWRW
jgi:hypothetical protein